MIDPKYRFERLERRVAGAAATASAEVAAHVAAADPHTQYATDADLAAHEAAANPHPGYATDADLAAHIAAADPHPGYLTAAEGNAAYAPVSHVGTGGTAHSVAIAGGAAGFMSGADKTKLDGIAAGATVNATDASLRDRTTHTGTQPAATVSGLAAVATSGSASDLGTGSLPAARIAAGTVTNTMKANMAANTLSGNATGAAGAPQDIALLASQFLARSAAGNISAKTLTDFALTLLDDTDANVARTTLGFASGTYTPTYTAVTNITTIGAASSAQYLAVPIGTGTSKVVTVSGRVTITPTAANLPSEVGISLPIAANFSTGLSNTCNGTGVSENQSDQATAQILPDDTNDRARLLFYSRSTTGRFWSWQFTYLVP